MKQPTPEQQRVFQQLRNTQVHEYLSALREEMRDGLETARGDACVSELQGGAKLLRALLKYIDP